MRRLVMTVGIAMLVVILLRPLYMNGAECNWLLLWILIGIPFGFHRLLIMIPKGYDLSGTIGFFVFGILISGVIGGFCFIFNVISGVMQTGRTIARRI